MEEDLVHAISRALERMPKAEAEAVRRRYGKVGGESASLMSIADARCVSRAEARDLVQVGLARLRADPVVRALLAERYNKG